VGSPSFSPVDRMKNEIAFPPMLQRSRSASLPRDLGDSYFLGESDFHSDVYDDTQNDGNSDANIESPETFSQLFSPYIILKIVIMIISGALSSILYEMVLKIDNGSSLFAAFALHLWIVLISLPNAIHYLIQPKIPIYYHLIIVLLSFSFLYLKSFAIQLLPMPLIIVCSNMQLVLGLLVGKFLFHKTFCSTQYLSVFAIALGCSLITLSSQYSMTSSSSSSSILETIKGIFFILSAILSISIMIPVGSMIVQKYNADIEEQIFFQHFLSFPLFYLQWNRIQPSIDRLALISTSSGESLSSPVVYLGKIPVPMIVLFLIGTTVLGQINRYLTMDISLSLNPLLSQLLNAVNKTIVLLVSMIYFNSPPYPTLVVWFGVAIQTIGSIGYVQASFSDTSSGNFKPNKRISRFSRVSLTGKRLGISEIDLNRLRILADHSEKERLIREANKSLEETRNELEKEIDVNVDKKEIGKNSEGMRRRVAYSALPDIKQ
jgi:drug/metabolite transporter (DMT)-like permease